MNSYVGKRFGKLTIDEDLGYYQKENTSRKRHYIKCKCDCGNETIVRLDAVKKGGTVSCGCHKADACQQLGLSSKKYNDFYIKDGIVHVVLNNSCNELLCDADDWARLKDYCWSEFNGYARARNPLDGQNVLFHKLVIKSTLVDHINGNGLDNRKCNLRAASKSQNAMNQKMRIDNTSGYKGIRPLPSGNYTARITVNGKKVYLGTFKDIRNAIAAREQAEIEYFGEFRRVA